MERKKPLENNAFCVLPWVHLHISTNGEFNPCCLTNESFGNINENTIEEIWNGEEINIFRRNLINNIKQERCNLCYLKEASGARSLRQHSNHSYERYLPAIFQAKELDRLTISPPIYFDIRFSNVCNFRCRTCYHGGSSRWFEEAALLGETVGSKPIIRAIEKNIQIFDVWKRFKKVFVVASLDGSHKRGEYLRKEQKWVEVLKSRELMKAKCPNVDFAVSVTVSAFNIYHLPDFHKELVDQSFIEINEFLIENFLQFPNYYSVHILPLEFKLKIKEKFERHLEWLKNYSSNKLNQSLVDQTSAQFRNCISYLFMEDKTNLLSTFVGRCKKIDELRQEKTVNVFPELDFLFDVTFN